jgi:RNA polymerase sigma-70 factor (ECF subfamily)
METPELLYKTYRKSIVNLAYRMTGNIDDANDIAQDTFIQAFKSYDKFKGESNIYTWLYRIAVNNCLLFLKNKRKSSFLVLEKLIETANTPVSEELTEDEKSAYIAQVKDGCLSGLIRCLSLQQRVAFILAVLLDIPNDQVAAVIGKSENATRILVHRARQNIREFLCNNCSLFDPNNKCRCENLIHFSLHQKWIEKNQTLAENTIYTEAEIKSLKRMILLYRSLHEKDSSSRLDLQIQQFLDKNENLRIFSPEKVK